MVAMWEKMCACVCVCVWCGGLGASWNLFLHMFFHALHRWTRLHLLLKL